MDFIIFKYWLPLIFWCAEVDRRFASFVCIVVDERESVLDKIWSIAIITVSLIIILPSTRQSSNLLSDWRRYRCNPIQRLSDWQSVRWVLLGHVASIVLSAPIRTQLLANTKVAASGKFFSSCLRMDSRLIVMRNTVDPQELWLWIGNYFQTCIHAGVEVQLDRQFVDFGLER